MSAAFNVRANVIVSGMAFALSIAAQVLIFRLAVGRIGLEAIGLFSLIQGLMLFARAFETGVGQNLVRRIAVARTEEDPERRQWQIILAGLALIVVPTTVLSIGAYCVIGAYLAATLPEVDPVTLHRLIALSVMIGLTSVTNSVFGAALDGFGKMVWRNLTFLGATLISVLLAVPLLKHFGVLGYAGIYLATSAVQLVLLSGILFVKFHHGLSRAGAGTGTVIVALFFENLAMNGSGLARLAFEPVTRIWLKEFSGLEAVGIFDILSRLVIGARALVQTAISPILYVGARQGKELTREQVRIFARGQGVVAQVAASFGIVTVLFSPLISTMLFGHLVPDVVIIQSILGVSAGFNLLGVVGYFLALSGGQVVALLWIHIVMLAINVGGGTLLGMAFSDVGVILAYAVMMTLGGLLSLRFMVQVDGTALLARLRATWWPAPLATLTLTVCTVIGATELLPQYATTITLLSGGAGSLAIANLARLLLPAIRNQTPPDPIAKE